MGMFSVKKQLAPDAKYLRAELSWDVTSGRSSDLDLSAFLLQKNGKVGSDNDFVFYNNGFSDLGAVSYGGDNRTGEGDGADENIVVRLKQVPSETEKILLCVSVNDDVKCTFYNIKNACLNVCIVNSEFDKDGEVIASVDLTRSHTTSSCLIAGELTRSGVSWKFAMPCEDVKGGLEKLCERFGIEVE